MTGPAKIARIITIIGIMAFAPVFAYAKAPRDAIKELPKITHYSDFYTISNSDSFTDHYKGHWQIDWNLPEVQLGAAKARIELTFLTDLTDNLNRLTSTSSDSRYDEFKTVLRFGTNSNYLRGDATYSHTGTSSGDSASQNERSWFPKTTKIFNLVWSQPSLPEFKVAHRIIDSYSYTGNNLNISTENVFTQLSFRYEPSSSAVNQRFLGTTELTENRNYSNPLAGTSITRNYFEGNRQVSLGAIGKLNIGVTYNEENKRQRADFDRNHNSQTKFFIGLNGDVLHYPLGYNFNYITRTNSFSNRDGEQYTDRNLQLNFRPPAPSGKSADLSISHKVADADTASSQTTTETQQAIWNFSTNPRTSGKVLYELSNTTDNLAEVRTKEVENLNGGLTYNIPGGRGSMNSVYHQTVTRNPVNDQSSINHGVNLNSSFKLSRKAQMQFIVSQNYNDSPDTGTQTSKRTENMINTINYSINSGQGFSMNARWRNRFTINPYDNKTSAQDIEINLKYNTPANWVYQLTLKSTDTSSESDTDITGSSYQTSDEIRAVVTYTF